MTRLELLAPARDLECGLAAIDHGADAVYIGAPAFGARAEAGNSIDDIRQLCDHAHRFLAKVYVTVNTIIYEEELEDVEHLVRQLGEAGVDAILVQDMAVLEMVQRVAAEQQRPIEVHASTQADNRTPERVGWLWQAGCSRVVLARELTLEQMRTIHQAVPGVELEAFVHGALCVSFSGLCYASQHCFHRSANRGVCAQFCRLKFDLVDGDGQYIDRPRYWLSLKDMCRIDYLGQMADAGITSFKIEGRLKGVGYVKNVVAAYSEQLDKVVKRSGGRYRRSALGRVALSFTPDLRKSFNRGFTPYFIDGRNDNIASPDTPKALGEYVGKVKEIRKDSFNVAGLATFANGDGLCFFDDSKQLCGFRVNRVEGNRIFPLQMPPQLRKGFPLYRNADATFEKLLAKPSATRRIPLDMRLDVTEAGLRLETMVSEGAGVSGTALRVGVEMEVERQEARQPQQENICRQLSRMGGTVYEAVRVEVSEEAARLFVPSSMLATLRRQCLDALDKRMVQEAQTSMLHRKQQLGRSPLHSSSVSSVASTSPHAHLSPTYLQNLANSQARAFYEQHGIPVMGEAFELGDSHDRPLLMQCRHCIRRLLGCCPKERHRPVPWKEPLFLQLPDKRRFRLQFDCQQCQMNVYAEK
ncbi:MAG: U32 family peptidase [Prevotella sp.]|nr:U32 family peptidase [Prevotella sp.]